MAEDDGGVSEEQRDLLDLGPTAENPGTAGPCSLAECPSVAKEVSLAGLNAVARQYPSEIWVAFGSPKDAKFIHERQGIKDAGDFTLEFQVVAQVRLPAQSALSDLLMPPSNCRGL